VSTPCSHEVHCASADGDRVEVERVKHTRLEMLAVVIEQVAGVGFLGGRGPPRGGQSSCGQRPGAKLLLEQMILQHHATGKPAVPQRGTPTIRRIGIDHLHIKE